MPAPPPTLADRLRTLAFVPRGLVPFFLDLALRDPPSTTTAAGLVGMHRAFRRMLGRLGVTLEVRHAARVPADGGLVFMWNQTSHLDHLILGAAVPRPFFSLYNNEVARVPVYGPHMRRTGHVHVDRGDEPQWRAALADAAARIRAGECVLLSPEGTRSRDGELLPLKRGAFILAEAAARPVVCVAVVGAHERMPRGSPWVRRGPVRVVFGAPIADVPPAELPDRVAAELRALCREHRL